MSVSTPKRAHPSTSEYDSTINSPPVEENKSKKKSKKKQKTIDDFIESNELTSREGNKMEQKLEEISNKLSHMLTKNDKKFIQSIIKSTIEEMKESLLSSVTRRIEILEGENHDHFVATANLEKEIKSKNEEIAKLKEENTQLKTNIAKETETREKTQNEAEQYSRRNTIRISGIPGDINKQSSESVTKSVVQILHEKTNLKIREEDVDIAHRVGKFSNKNTRQVVVKFVRRQTKISVMKVAKELRESEIFINEDLTRLNQQVLASLRLKDPTSVHKCWSFEGRIFAVFKSDTDKSVEIQYKDYQFWLDKPWPKR